MRRAQVRAVEREERRNRQRAQRAALGAGTAIGATVLFAPSAQAATFTVTNLDDNGAGSLRQAILDANAAGGDDTVVFQSGLSGTINLSTGEIPITTDGLAIQGPGAGAITIDANLASRIFYVQSFSALGKNVSISGLTLTRGRPTVDGYLGGALYSDTGGGEAANVTLSDMVVTNSSANGRGGAVWQDFGSLTIVNSTFSGNTSESDDGGGAIYMDDSEPGQPALVIRDSTITGNTAAENGGGVASGATDGDIVIENSTFSNNTATNRYGGAIWLDEVFDPSSIKISNSTITGNKATWGGGVYLYRGSGPVTVENTTISGNHANYGAGALWTDPTAGTTTIRNSTIANNDAYYTGGVFFDDDNTSPANPLTITSSIIADNTATDPTPGDPAFYGTDIGMEPSAGGFATSFSLIEKPDGVNIGETPAGSNIIGTDPQLGALTANGGPTQTHLPALSSPALDSGIANGLTTDQRGLPRTVDLSTVSNRAGSDATDMGAVEVAGAACQGPVVPAKTGTDGNDTLTGTDGPDSISALAGADTADGLTGRDCVSGDDGKDTVKGGPDKDLVRGGGGRDKGRGQGGKDTVKGEAGKDNLAGGGGDDKVVGGDGKDIVKGGGGKDKLKGNAGADVLKARDGAKDKVNCGGGDDKAVVDGDDKVAKNCEEVVET